MNIRLSFIIIILDFSTKLIVNNWLNDGIIIRINKNLNLTLLHNNSSFNSCICILGIGFLIWIKKNYGCYELIIGGTIGNIIDKLGHGYIIDFLSVHWLDKYYLVLNIADISIMIGGFISLI
ncbi:Lipoprotein signal peptidase [Candidatus Portiera aleyrodidarum]|uniref:Lipoprotein signal peptidase n=1 Tax=Candidatus Portiera aleyrodidarum TV TaxID=1297582 RepID=A0A8D3X8G7_9GAMM|nr:signal peptidase II [Candidatus Portiera aleyrodidarum]AGI27096.1 Lipoprotein signal peptidase [Candidatus Portiera aleyrodidarum TV]CEI59063.1 Lipoprotein signal peptidase [Candidatus Portiera aleyrodidarum]